MEPRSPVCGADNQVIHPRILKAMLDAGASAEIIAAATMADAEIERQRLDDRREKDRERQRRHRERRDALIVALAERVVENDQEKA